RAGVVSITRSAAQVLAPHRITSNCICPGAVDTPMWRKIDAEWSELEGWQTGEAWKRRTSVIPLGRPETAEDVAGVVSFLASRDADYMTGQAVNVDGGLVMGTGDVVGNCDGARETYALLSRLAFIEPGRCVAADRTPAGRRVGRVCAIEARDARGPCAVPPSRAVPF